MVSGKISLSNVLVRKSLVLVKIIRAIDDDSSYMQEIVAEDIQKFGLIPDPIGRFPQSLPGP